MLSTCLPPTVTSAAAAPVALPATRLPEPPAPSRARFRRLVVFDGKIA